MQTVMKITTNELLIQQYLKTPQKVTQFGISVFNGEYQTGLDSYFFGNLEVSKGQSQ